MRLVCFIVVGLVGMALMPVSLMAKESLKLSLGQYRVSAQGSSYWFTPVSVNYGWSCYKLRASVPFIKRDEGASGLGNASLKISYLSSWQFKRQKLYVDYHLKQKLATSDSSVTLAVKDTGASVEVSAFLLGGVGFVELGHWWREANPGNLDYSRENSFHYALGGVYPIKKSWVAGLVLDHKPTALGNLDRAASALLQYKISTNQKVTATVGKGLTNSSPDWISGLVWKVTL